MHNPNLEVHKEMIFFFFWLNRNWFEAIENQLYVTLLMEGIDRAIGECKSFEREIRLMESVETDFQTFKT